MKNKDTQSRKWQLTINNPQNHGFTHDWIQEILQSFKAMAYWCMADEVGEEETYHTHIYMVFKSAVRFSSIKKKFDVAHIEMARGTNKENREYVFKQGKWEKDKKSETNIKSTQKESGDMPIERPGARNDMADLLDMIMQGMTNNEIIKELPQQMLNIDKIERVRQSLREDEFGNDWRELSITYVYGKTGTGKTSDIVKANGGYKKIYRVTNYDNPFDLYKGEKVIVFEEFRSSLKMGDMLQYLDGHPATLPCRYSDKIAGYTTVYIVSNIPIEDQYKNVQKEEPETWRSFLRRINIIKEYTADGVREEPLAETMWYRDDVDSLPVR